MVVLEKMLKEVVSVKRRVSAILMALCLLLAPTALSHSGRTDSSGGHRDNKNKSGLGSYHYHCGGNPAHLHTGGTCPYGGGTTKPLSGGDTSRSSKPSATKRPSATSKPSAQPTPRAASLPESKLAEGGTRRYGKTSTDVNMREGASTKARRMGVLDKHVAFEIIEIIEDDDGDIWYHIWLDGEEGYLKATYAEEIAEASYRSGL